MTLYLFTLVLGAVGLLAMALGGAAHLHGGGHATGAGHVGHGGHLHGGHLHGGQAHAGHAGALRGGARGGRGFRDGLWLLLSPRSIFGFLVGFGSIGLLGERLLGGGALVAVATLGGLAFEGFVLEPLWRFFFRFASAPALTLESCIEDEARAVTNFDATGHGLIALELDGQVVQVLGTLRREDREAGLRIRAGDRVRVDAVDDARNRCTVRPI